MLLLNWKENISSIMDDLVPVQRKILYCSFKKNLVKEIKVNQFIGYVYEECAYHRDEKCLAKTIIRMTKNLICWKEHDMHILMTNKILCTVLPRHSSS
jgi:hypothetical protein